MLWKSTRHFSSAVASAVVVVSCNSAPIAPPQSEQFVSQIPFGVEQAITVTPVEPRTGENITIESVITNVSTSSLELTSRICGLNLGGDLEMSLPLGVVRCAGFSQTVTLLPGETIRETELRTVNSPAGIFTLEVQHLLDPTHTGEAEIRVVE